MQLTAIRACDPAGARATAPPPGRLRARVLDILASNRLCSIATVTADRRAHIHTAYFCFSSQLDLFFLSHPSALHCRNLATHRSAAATVFSSAQTWSGPDRGLQLFGTCAPATGAERLYARRFPAYTASEYRFYRFRPRQLKLLDEAEFGDGIFVTATIRRSSRGSSSPISGR
ncbi:MAG TPA: pyridoxamine 5'-phosphate oxidase family protein [Polyangia bacterium]|nr:pyridoxamine 5'-phosphate oxidase family protein [Polyangia bacterium]